MTQLKKKLWKRQITNKTPPSIIYKTQRKRFAGNGYDS